MSLTVLANLQQYIKRRIKIQNEPSMVKRCVSCGIDGNENVISCNIYNDYGCNYVNFNICQFCFYEPQKIVDVIVSKHEYAENPYLTRTNRMCQRCLQDKKCFIFSIPYIVGDEEYNNYKIETVRMLTFCIDCFLSDSNGSRSGRNTKYALKLK